MSNGPHTYGQCRYCTEYHFTYPVKETKVTDGMMRNGLSAIAVLHHESGKDGTRPDDLVMKDFGEPPDVDWAAFCCECEQKWPCATYQIAARALGFEELEN